MDIPAGDVMIQELDTVILVKDHPDQGLVKGDVGAIFYDLNPQEVSA